MAADLFKKQTYLKKNKNGRTEAKSFGQYYWAYLYTLKEKNSALNVKIRKKKKTVQNPLNPDSSNSYIVMVAQ